MDIIGVIRAVPDPPGVEERAWIDLIGKHPALSAVPPRNATNPFTGKPMPVSAKSSTARVTVDGAEVGMMSWSLVGTNEIDVHGDPRLVEPVAAKIAKALGGQYARHK
jgi:hypothetical protein